MNISISIVLFNADPEELNKIMMLCDKLENVEKIFLIDNGGSSFSQNLSKKRQKKYTYINSRSNIGYGAGHNVALAYAKDNNSDLHIVMNSDLFFDPIEVSKFLFEVNRLENFLIAGPRIINPKDQNLSYFKYSPTFLSMVLRFLFSKKFQYNLQISNLDHEIFHCPYLSGAFLVFNIRKIDKLGFFDERFFMYPEDMDISLRASLLDGSVGFNNYTITHEHRAGSKRSKWLLLIHIFNMLKFFWKWNIQEKVDLVKVNQKAGSKF